MKKNNLLLVILMSTISLSYGQTSFSIAEAIEYSVNNNANIKNSTLIFLGDGNLKFILQEYINDNNIHSL